MFRSSRPASSDKQAAQAGVTLVELLIAVGITAILVAAATSLWRGVESAALKASTTDAVAAEFAELAAVMQRHWNVRRRPGTYSGSFTAAAKGFDLRSRTGLPCSSNCARLLMTVQRGAAIDQTSVRTSCVAPGAVPGLSRLQKLSFDAAMPAGCQTCQPGLIPVVQVASIVDTALARRFPHNGATAPSTYVMSGILGMSVCFSQTGTGPLHIDMRAYTLDPRAAEDQVRAIPRSLLFPFDNFGNVRLETQP